MRLALILCALAPTSLGAAPLTYLESFPQVVDPTSLAHLLDNTKTTSWCTPKPDASARLRFHFSSPQAISSARIILSDTPSSPIDINLTNDVFSIALSMSHRQLKVDLPRPLQGTHIDLIVPPSLRSVCISGIELYSEDGSLTHIKGSLKNLKARLALAGAWKSGPLGSPRATWTFSLDGTWSWKKKETLLAHTRRLRGEWTLKHNQLILKLPGQKRHIRLSLARHLVEVDEWAEDAPDANYEEIAFQSELATPLRGRYNNARFEMLE